MKELAVPFNDLGRAVAAERPQLDSAFARVLDSGWFVMGPEHNALEAELAAYAGVSDAIAVANGTDALALALAGVGVAAGDLVATVANAGGYSSAAIRRLGAQALYVDVDPQSLLLDLTALDAALESPAGRPKAIVVTHLFGQLVPMQGIRAWAEANDVLVIEDCAQAFGARDGDRRAGSWGHAAAVSFYPTKNLGALGDAGAVLTQHAEIAERVRRLRQYGWGAKYRIDIPGGTNSRLDELQAAVLRLRLERLDERTERRRQILARYREALGDGPVRFVGGGAPDEVGHLAVLLTDDRQRVRQLFADAHIGTDVHYPIPDHLQVGLEAAPVSLPVTESAAERVLSVPLFPELTDDEVAHVERVLREVNA